jgi:hypothetical protein
LNPFGDNMACPSQGLLTSATPFPTSMKGATSWPRSIGSWVRSLAARGSRPFSRATVPRVRRLGLKGR